MVLSAGQTDSSAVFAFAQATSKNLTENVAEAAKSAVDTLISVVTRWQQTVLKEHWNGLRFIATASHMAREGSLVDQVLSRLLSLDPDHPDVQPNTFNDRMIMLDDITLTETDALELLGTHYTDYGAGLAFFDTEHTLHRDILSNATLAYLDQLFPS